MQTLPEKFLTRLQSMIPTQYFSQVIDSFSAKKPCAFRINTLKISIDEAKAQLLKNGFELIAVAWNDVAYLIPFSQREKLIQDPLFLDGKIYIQSLSSQIPAFILNPQLNEEVLDLTAAPGSKTTQLAMLMQNTGRIAAVEIVKDRFFKLKANCKQQGATNIQFYFKDGARVGRACPDRFDRVLLDAPCSSEGRFDLNDPESFSYWSEKKIKSMSKKQWALLLSAFEALKPGGTLVYSTCTFAPEENELMIQRFLEFAAGHVELLPVEINLPLENVLHPIGLPQTLRVLPNEVMDGFFVAKMKKR